jgi:fructokinase
MITVAGEALIDLIVDAQSADVRASPGGGPFNTARAVARLGQPVKFLGRLSSDRFGRELAGRLDADGVRLAGQADAAEPTTLALADIDEAGIASYRFYLTGTAAAALSGAVLPAGTTALHIGTLSLVMEPIASTIEQLVRSLPGDVLLMLDPNCRPAAIADREAYLARITRLMGRVDIVKTSTEDLRYLVPHADPAAVAAGLVSGDRRDATGPAAGLVSGPVTGAVTGPAAVVVTDGAAAVHAYVGGQVVSAKAPPVDVVDTVGAGDAFGGAFLAWWASNGLTRDDVGKPGKVAAATVAATEAAAIACTTRGAEPPWLWELRGKPGWPAVDEY